MNCSRSRCVGSASAACEPSLESSLPGSSAPTCAGSSDCSGGVSRGPRPPQPITAATTRSMPVAPRTPEGLPRPDGIANKPRTHGRRPVSDRDSGNARGRGRPGYGTDRAMRILIADKFSERGLELLRGLGHDVTYEPGCGADQLPTALARSRFDVLVVRSTIVSEAAFAAGAALSLVIRAGAGVNNIDLEAASRRGVFVSNCPGKNAIAVAELAFGLIVALDRRIGEASHELQSGRWNKKKYGKGQGLYGRRLGLVGYGAIARELATRARAFGLQVAVYSRSVHREHADAHKVQVCETLDELLRTSEIVSVHVPYRESTRHLIGARELALLPDGALLIHTARGG